MLLFACKMCMVLVCFDGRLGTYKCDFRMFTHIGVLASGHVDHILGSQTNPFCLVTCTQVKAQEVFAITFRPDKAVACVLPEQKPVVLSKGLTEKTTRRGKGKGRSGELESLPDTAPGEYED